MGLTDDRFLPNSVPDEAAKRFDILGDCGLIAPEKYELYIEFVYI